MFSLTDLQMKRKHIQTWCRELCVSPGNPNTFSLLLLSWALQDGFTGEEMNTFLSVGRNSEPTLWLTRRAVSVYYYCLWNIFLLLLFFSIWSYGRIVSPGQLYGEVEPCNLFWPVNCELRWHRTSWLASSHSIWINDTGYELSQRSLL